MIKERNVPIDFYTFHLYLTKTEKIAVDAKRLYDRFEEYGIEDVEVYIDEWNYVRGWSGSDYEYSMENQKKLKSSSLVAGVMCAGQYCGIDGLMYYNAGSLS